MEKIKISLPVIVEGKYDKNTLLSVIDATVITTGGFSVFNNRELRSLIKRLAERDKIILLTDSDGGGIQIRSFIEGIVPRDRIVNLYIPKVEGKERRKKAAGKAGLLGVEGIDADVLRKIFEPLADGCGQKPKFLNKTKFFEDGFSGGSDSSARREALARAYSLPHDMSANALIEAINLISNPTEYKQIKEKMKNDKG